MQAFCATRTSSPEDTLVASARLAIEFAGSAQRMPLVRIDRRGFAIGVTDDAHLPPLGLPRQARVICDDATLCEPRLVARCLAHARAPALEMTLQPSRSDDDTAFWQALYAYRLRQRSSAGEHPAMPMRRPNAGAGPLAGARIDALRATASPTLTDCEAVLMLPVSGDAAFLSAWLEYHFAEIAARAHIASTHSDLRDLVCRLEQADVAVTFEYRLNGKNVHAVTRETCTWIAGEVERLFGLALRYEVSATRKRAGAMSYRQRPPTLTS